MTELTVANSLAHRCIVYWRKMGCTESTLQRILGEHYDKIEEPNFRFPAMIVSDAFTQMAEALNDPLLGIKTGLYQIHSSVGELGNLVNTAKDIRQMLKVCVRFLDLLTQVCDYSYVENQYGAEFKMTGREGVPLSPYHVDACISSFIRFITLACPSPSYIMYLQKNPSAFEQQQYKSLLNSDIYFNHGFDGFYVPNAVLDTPISVLPEKYFWEEVKNVQSIYDKTPGTRGIRALVLSKIRHANLYDQVSLERISDQLMLNPRTLQNKLKEENTSFRALLEESRLEVVAKMVKEGSDMSSIAKQAGYNDTAAFQRAFKRWKDMSFHDFYQMQNETETSDSVAV